MDEESMGHLQRSQLQKELFEEVLQQTPPKVQQKLLYHIDLLNYNNPPRG